MYLLVRIVRIYYTLIIINLMGTRSKFLDTLNVVCLLWRYVGWAAMISCMCVGSYIISVLPFLLENLELALVEDVIYRQMRSNKRYLTVTVGSYESKSLYN